MVKWIKFQLKVTLIKQLSLYWQILMYQIMIRLEMIKKGKNKIQEWEKVKI